nr:hypothetical protein [uncultured Sphingobacterium sp.]
MKGNKNLKSQFLNSLKRGTGEAYLIAKSNPNIDFSNQIIKGALNIFAYDGQCEGNRAQYIFDIISLSKQKTKVRKAVLKGLAKESDDTWNLTHLFALTKLYAEKGDTEARQAIYDRFLHNPIFGSDWVGYSEILDLDGLDGLLYISEKFGKYLEQNPDDWQDDSIISEFQEESKHLNVYKELEKKAKKNKYIHIYLDAVFRNNNSRKKNNSKPTIFKDIIDEIYNSKPILSFKRKNNLTEEEVTLIAEQLIIETDKSKIEKLLSIFDRYRFPLDSEVILNFAKQKRSSKYSIVENAVYALQHLKSKSIRRFALDKIQNSKNPIDYLEILISNYKKGDHKILTEIVANTNYEDEVESLAAIFTEIYKVNKTKKCKEPLEILYNKMNCGIHRNGIIEILIENGILSKKIKKEMKFDSYLKTRELVK